MDFGSLSVTQLKEYLKVRGVSAASTVGKNGLVQLCHVSKNLSEDPDFEKCDTWEKITKKLGKIGIFKDPTEMNFANVTMSNVPRFGMMDNRKIANLSIKDFYPIAFFISITKEH